MQLAAFLSHLLLFLSPLSKDEQEDETCVNKTKRPYTILVEGNVGSGKSTMLQFFAQEAPGLTVVSEPVEKWQDIDGVDLLEKVLSKDGKKWTTAFQLYSALTRYQNDLKTFGSRARMMERSVFSGRACFLESLKQTNSITKAEYLVVDSWFKVMTKNLAEKLKPDLILYLRCDIDVLLERIRHRGRPEEVGIDKVFLERLQRLHDDWLIHGNGTLPAPAKVMVIDGNLQKRDFLDSLRQLKGKILTGSGLQERQ